MKVLQSSPISLTAKAVEKPCSAKEVDASRRSGQKRKRSHEAESSQERPLEKRPRTSSSKALEDIQAQSPVLDEPRQKQLHTGSSDRIQHWIHESRWPERDFEPDPNMNRPAPKRSRSSSSQGRQSETDGPVPSDGSDQRSRTLKTSPYAKPGYATLLAYKKGYMCDSKAGILASEKDTCRSLLDTQQVFPSGSLFDDECFLEVCANLQDENEMRVVIDLLRLIAPSAENLAAWGMEELKCLKEHTNAGWNESIPIEGPRPQPDYSVGFRFSTFSDDQINKLHRHLKLDAKTFFSATLEMFFPFLTSEIKCGKQALNIADRQNAHSMAVAIRGVVELFRKVGRAQELHRKALGFSISHDSQQVRIYVHYPEIDGVYTSCYRHLLKSFDILSEDGKERWSAYRFVRNVYDSFVPDHLERIKSAIDQLPSSALESSQSTRGVEDAEDAEGSQEIMATTAPSSQEVGFKKPDLPKRGITAVLQAQIDQLIKEKEQASSKASSTELVLQQELERQRQENERQRQENNQRHAELMEQNKKLMTMLEQRLG